MRSLIFATVYFNPKNSSASYYRLKLFFKQSVLALSEFSSYSKWADLINNAQYKI